MAQQKVKLQFLHPSGALVTHEFAPTDSLADVHAALVPTYAHPDNSPIFSRSPQPTAEGALENSPQFKKTAGEAWQTAGNGARLAEAGFSVDRSGSYSKVQVRENPPDSPGGMRVEVPPGSIFVHTHGNQFSPEPSPTDIDSARSHKSTIYVVSSKGLFAIDPTGNVTQPYKSASDIFNKKKRADK